MKYIAVLLFAMLAIYSAGAVQVREPTAAATHKVQGVVGCDLCTYVVTLVENYVEKNISQAQIIANLDNACTKLGPVATECKLFVDTFGPTIIARVNQAQNPTTICTDIGACSSKKTNAKKESDVKCSICSYLVGKIESYLDLNLNETQIMSELQNACTETGPLAQICTDVVNIYGPTLIQKLQSEENPLTVCTEVGLCTSTVKKPVAKKAVKGDAECSLCSYLVGKIEGYVEGGQPWTESEVITALENDCSDLGGLSSVCKTLVSLYGPELINGFLNATNPLTVCADVGLCNNKAAQKKVPVVQKPIKNDVECTLCSYIVGKIEGYLNLNLSQAQIETELDAVCSKLGALSSVCDGFVSAYAPTIIQLLQNEVNPLTICTEIGVCSSTKKIAVKGSTECTLCSYLVGKIETYLENGYNVTQIIPLLETDCNNDLGPLGPTCASIVAVYGPKIIQYLNNNMSPLAICTDLGLCTSSAARPNFFRATLNH